MRAACDKTLLLQAEFDGELGAAESAALAEHRAHCPVCAENWRLLATSRAAIEDATRHEAPTALRQSLERRLAPAAAHGPSMRRRRGWGLGREALSFGLGAALAASLALVLLPRSNDSLVASVVDDHVRSLEPGHLTDVLSTDQHTVKPWFDGRLDFAPPVKNFASQGFPLVGGRLDYLGGHAVAALAYTHGKHPINLFVWPERGEAEAPVASERNGYNVVHWREGGMAFWAVSDVEEDQLEAFVADWRKPG